jgi:hypothetical protein
MHWDFPVGVKEIEESCFTSNHKYLKAVKSSNDAQHPNSGKPD